MQQYAAREGFAYAKESKRNGRGWRNGHRRGSRPDSAGSDGRRRAVQRQALASAVASAVSGTTLSLAAKCVYNLKAALPEVSKVLTINGNRATLQRSYAAGTAAFTILTVAGSGILTISELNFRHGGGAIAVIDLGQLTVNGGTFTGNAAADGGAIYSNAGTSAPQINDATFARNTATGSGGAIYNNSASYSVSVNGSVFTGNKAAADGAIWEYGIGGTVTAATFRGNTAGTQGS